MISSQDGGTGGAGGKGGNGGVGGNGSAGRAGGNSGAGGGAVEIMAQGRINFGGSISVRGAAGSNGANPISGQSGSSNSGASGAAGQVLFPGGDGGNGGAGSSGGQSGNGGGGGGGGHGGGGAGGTVMFKSTLFSAAGGIINTSGGSSFGNAGGNGRYAVSENGAGAVEYGTRSGASEHFFDGQSGNAARDVNPYFQAFGTTTFNIAGLAGGADVYGIMSGVSASDGFFDDVRANAPLNAVAALVRTNAGPTGDDYLGQDHLMLVNLTDEPLANPTLGLATPGNIFSIPLAERGFAKNPAFGGGGPAQLSELPAGAVYATLVDQAADLDITLGGNGSGVIGVAFETLDVFYFEPFIVVLLGDFDLDGDVDGRDFLTWQRNPSVGDLAAWQANYDFGTLSAASVPEPGSAVLIAVVLAGAVWRRCDLYSLQEFQP